MSSFLAMTMGGWYLGSALFAWEGARLWQWSTAHPLLLYSWLFGFFQALLLLVHADVLRFGEALAWPYVVTLCIAALAAGVAAVDLALRRPAREQEGARTPGWVRVLIAAFVVAVTLLALPLVDGYDSPRSIWPGELTLISARSFAVFFGALGLSALPLVFARGLGAVIPYMRAGIVLNIAILVAAGVYIGEFDVADHPGGLIYIGLYVVVLVLSLTIVGYARRGTPAEVLAGR